MSVVSYEVISKDKAIRHITSETKYPIKVWCDNRATGKNTEIEGCHKLKGFDESVEKVKENLRFTEDSGKRKSMSKSHGDYIKPLVKEGKVKVHWVNTKDNTADIMTKPLDWRKYSELIKKILNN